MSIDKIYKLIWSNILIYIYLKYLSRYINTQNSEVFVPWFIEI